MIGFYDYTVILTYMSLISSVTGIIMALNGRPVWAIFCLMFSGLCDMFDGKVASTKKNRTDDHKNFGIQIDSLCDIVCFGVFPVVIGYSLNIRSIFGYVCMALYVLAGVIRLAYFNVCTEKKQKKQGVIYIHGLPITSAALIFPILMLVSNIFGFGAKIALIYEIVLAITAILFVIDIKIQKPGTRGKVIMAIVGIILFALYYMVSKGIISFEFITKYIR